MGELFDDLARALARTPSRRKALGTIAGALTSAALVNLWPRAVEAKTCPPGQVACGKTGQCLPTSGKSWLCCGYKGTAGSGTACAPGMCNSANVCCQGGQKTCGAACCQAGGSCCDQRAGLCCPANQQCQNGKCVPRGSGGGGGGGRGCPPGQSTCGGACCPSGSCLNGQCCSNGHTVCGSLCCAPNQQCKNGQCVPRGAPGGGSGGGKPPQGCPPNSATCGTSGQCCPTSGTGQCCGSGASAGCCWGGTCVNGVCVRGGGGPPHR
jgi:hypothetical protein